MTRPYILRFKLFHYYIIPLVAVVVWWGMLIALMSCWSLQGHPIYWFMSTHQDPVYISDIGATSLKPLFISCAGFQGIFFVGSLVFEFYLRSKGKLQPYLFDVQKKFAWASIGCGIIGELGILMVSIFDTNSFHHVHIAMLVVFIVFIFLSCCFNFTTYYIFFNNSEKLSPRSEKVIFGPTKWQNLYFLNFSFKVFWLCAAICFAAAFGGLEHKGYDSKGAAFEWTLSYWYGVLLISWSADLMPAAYHHYKLKHPDQYPPQDKEAQFYPDSYNTNPATQQFAQQEQPDYPSESFPQHQTPQQFTNEGASHTTSYPPPVAQRDY